MHFNVKEDIIQLTSRWEGERLPDGRPKVSDEDLNELRKLTLEEIWAPLYNAGYLNQFEEKLYRLHDDRKLVGRAVTASFLPARPDLEETVKNGETTTPFPEKYRVMFEGIPCWPKLPALFKPLKEHGVNVTAVVYAPAFGFVYNNMDEMARAYYKAPNSVCIEQGVDWREGICRDNKVDGVLVHYNRSCKPWSGYMAEMQRRFTDDLGVPCAGFDGDQADPRNFNAAQYETRVQGLVEAMEANKQAKEA